MDRITNGWFIREMQIYLSGFKRPNSSQDDIPREIAVGSSTETKYLNMLSGEWSWHGRDPNITGFDRLMSPLELSNYIIGIMSGEIKPNTYVYLRSSLPTEVIKAREYLGCSTEKMLGELIAILRESEYYRNARDKGETDEAIVEHFIRTLESVTMTPNTRAEINDTKEYFQHMDENIAVFIDNENVGEILKLLLLELTRDEQISGILENIASIEEKYFSNESNETKETDPNQDPEKRKKQSIDKAKKRTAIMKYLIFSVALGEYRYDANGLLFVGEEQIGLPIPENKIDEIYEKITEPISPETEGQISRQRITRLHYIKTLVDRKEEETIRNLLDAHFNGLDLATETIIKLVRSRKRKNNTRYRLKPGKLTYGAYDHRSDLSIEQVVGNLLRIKKPEDGSWVLQRERKPTEVEMRTGTKEGDGGEYETTYSCIYRIIMFPNGTYRILVNGIPGTPYAIHGQNNAIWGVIDN